MSLIAGIMSGLVVLFFYTICKVERVNIGALKNNTYRADYIPYKYSKSWFSFIYKRFLVILIPENLVCKFAFSLGIDIGSLQDSIEGLGLGRSISAMEIAIMKLLGILSMVFGMAVYLAGKSLFALFTGFIGMMLLYFLPKSKLDEAYRKRQENILYELPGFIEQTYMCIEAGADLRQALEFVAEKSKGELSRAFFEVFSAASYVSSWERELSIKAASLKVEAFEDFVNDILLAKSKGVEISAALIKEIEHINAIRKAKIMERISSLEAELTLPIMMFCMLPMFAIVMLPVFIQAIDIFG